MSDPGPASAVLPAEIRAEITEHARRDYPNEACGMIVGSGFPADGGRALRFVATRNAANSPLRYEIDSIELLAVTLEVERNDEEIWGIVHSHTHTPAEPSATDIGLAFYPDALYLLISLSETAADPATGEPGIRAWRIVEGEVFEVALSAA